MAHTCFRRTRDWLACGLVVVFVTTIGAAAPPKVTQSVPADGSKDVDPTLREIRITFDQNMDRSGFSICGGGPNFPKLIGRARWASARVLVMRVKLEPEHDYAMSVNCPSAQNTRSAKGESAEIYPISFRTAAAKGGATSRPAEEGSNADAVKELRRAIDEDYSYRDLHKLNWEELFTKHRAGMENAKSPRAFADEAAKLLENAKDLHVWLMVGDQMVPTAKRRVPRNCDLGVLAKLVPGWQQRSKCVFTGRFNDGIGYIMITTWSKSDDNPHRAAFEALADLKDAKALIVDVRPNAGGDEGLAQEFAGCFIDKPAVYAKDVYRSPDAPGGFTKPYDRAIKPSRDRPKYRGKIAVLMGLANMSSCESFLLMMKQVPGCKLIGEKSYGASGNPKPHDLGNGVVAYLSSWKDMRPDGTCFETEGLAPDIPVRYPQGGAKTDPVLDAALQYLRAP